MLLLLHDRRDVAEQLVPRSIDVPRPLLAKNVAKAVRDHREERDEQFARRAV
ncbi:hypothetical protein chiPu_0032209, partial [Chiloscyllium punctatum]|nr:hypothetical protein [Chiloscyllium punctatum]